MWIVRNICHPLDTHQHRLAYGQWPWLQVQTFTVNNLSFVTFHAKIMIVSTEDDFERNTHFANNLQGLVFHRGWRRTGRNS